MFHRQSSLRRHLENDFQFDGRTKGETCHAIHPSARDLIFSEHVFEKRRSSISDFRLIADISESSDRHTEPIAGLHRFHIEAEWLRRRRQRDADLFRTLLGTRRTNAFAACGLRLRICGHSLFLNSGSCVARRSQEKQARCNRDKPDGTEQAPVVLYVSENHCGFLSVRGASPIASAAVTASHQTRGGEAIGRWY